MNKFEQISSTVKFKNPYWEYKFDRYVLPSGGKGEYHYVNSRGASMVIPVTEDKEILLVNQYRYLNQRMSLEFPGGGVKENSSYEATALEELKEETGAICDDIYEVGQYNPFNGVTNEITKIYIAKIKKIDSKKPEETEDIDIRFVTVDEMEKAIAYNEIWDGMTLAAWSLFRYSKYFGELL